MNNVISRTVTLLFLASPIAAIGDQGTRYSPDHMWGSGGWMWGGMYMWVIMFLLVVLGVYALSKSSKSANKGASDPTSVHTPLEILNERFAKGEIDKDDYESRKNALQS